MKIFAFAAAAALACITPDMIAPQPAEACSVWRTGIRCLNPNYRRRRRRTPKPKPPIHQPGTLNIPRTPTSMEDLRLQVGGRIPTVEEAMLIPGALNLGMGCVQVGNTSHCGLE
jgi:hypothetical protein